MDATALRAMQAPLKDLYKSDPNAAYITLRAKGTLDDTNIACKVETGRALAVAGLHPATGGSGLELCSGDMLLEALVACAGVTDAAQDRLDQLLKLPEPYCVVYQTIRNGPPVDITLGRA